MTDPASPGRTRRPLLIGGTVLGIALAGVAALYGTWVAGSNGRNAPAAGGCEGAAGTATRIAPLARGEVAAVTVEPAPKPAPPIAFVGPRGEPLTLANFRGRTVLLNLWATWCAPCRHEMPALDRLQASFGDGTFEVVAVNLDTRNLDKPKAWLADNGIRSLVYYADPTGRILPLLQQSAGATGLPTSLLIDAAGCQVAILKGPAEWASEDALRLLRAALGR